MKSSYSTVRKAKSKFRELFPERAYVYMHFLLFILIIFMIVGCSLINKPDSPLNGILNISINNEDPETTPEAAEPE